MDPLSSPRLTVVVPTRNRPQALFRLLQSISEQTLAPVDFEVVVVDDGSDPPVDTGSTEEFSFPVKLLRRTGRPGAHESRCAGLLAARGQRVLFIDDDVILQPTVLAEHAAVQGEFAIGPILYHPEAMSSPYQRYQARLYAACANSVISRGPRISAEELYICNASGPRELFRKVLEGVCAIAGGMPVPGCGCDELLMDYQLMGRGSSAEVLNEALVLHIDSKTLEQARRESISNGVMVCHLLLKFPELRQAMPGYKTLTGGNGLYRMWRIRLIWIAPRVFRLAADMLTKVADRGPPRWVPSWTCYLPLGIAFWEGMRKVAPSYVALRTAVLDHSICK